VCLAKFDVWLFVLNAFLCPLNLTVKFLPVCPTYALLQLGHVSLYTPDCAYLSDVCCLCTNNLWMVLLVRNAIPMSVFLNRFVIKVVSFPTSVNVANFCIVVVIRSSGAMVECLGGGGWYGWIGKSLFCMMLRIVFS
jgi:hypothetical protein